ncbi:MAG: phage baseplate assembly protein V [Kofleriaceae bacterium]
MRPGGPRGDTLDQLQYGLHYAIVCQNNDPDKLGRVKVRLPWLDRGDSDQTHWAQLLTPMAGNQFGWYTLPDVDDVVVVMFIAGDVSQPVIIGGVWSKPDSPPEPNSDGANNFRGYRSRSGHRLIFDDTDQVKLVVADNTTKNMVGIGKFDRAGTGPNVCAIYKPAMAGSSGVSISSMEGRLEVTCKSGTLKVTGANIKISAETAVDIKAGGDLRIDGSSTAKLTSGSPSDYDAPKVNIA